MLGGALTIDEAYDSIDWKTIILVAAMIPLSIAGFVLALIVLPLLFPF